MKTLCKILLWFVSVIGCEIETVPFKTPEKVIAVPVVVYFPSKEVREQYEDKIHEGIALANSLFKSAAISFYVDSVLVTSYDTMYDHERDASIVSQHDFTGVIPIFLVEEVKYKGKSWAGLAWRSGNCNRYNLVAYPINRVAVIAHELGHTMGLQHAELKTNVMYPTVPMIESATVITGEQARQARSSIEDFTHVCGGPGCQPPVQSVSVVEPSPTSH